MCRGSGLGRAAAKCRSCRAPRQKPAQNFEILENVRKFFPEDFKTNLLYNSEETKELGHEMSMGFPLSTFYQAFPRKKSKKNVFLRRTLEHRGFWTDSHGAQRRGASCAKAAAHAARCCHASVGTTPEGKKVKER